MTDALANDVQQALRHGCLLDLSGRVVWHKRGARREELLLEASRAGEENLCLRGANLRGLHFLEHLRLPGSDLRGADLRRSCFLAPVVLRGADLRGARLCRSHLSSIILEEAQLQGADFRGSKIGGATFDRARAEEVSFQGVDIWHSSLRDVDMTWSDWTGARGRGLAFAGADLRGADFSRFRGTNCNWSQAVLLGAFFEEARLRDCFLPSGENSVSSAETFYNSY